MRLGWRQGVLYLTTLGMEGCWLYSLTFMLNQKAESGRLSVLGLLLLYPVSFAVNSQLKQLRWHRFALRSLSGLMWLVAMLLMVKFQVYPSLPFSDTAWLVAAPKSIIDLIFSFKPELLILLSSAVFWWLGRRMAYVKMNFALTVGEFQFGLIMLLIALVIVGQLNISLNSLPVALVFFLFALVGASIAHAQEGTSWLSGLYSGHWAGLLLISVGLILVLGFVIGSLVNHDFLQLIVTALKWIWALIMKVIAFIASLFPEPEPGGELPTMPPTPSLEPPEEYNWFTMPETLRQVLRIGLFVVWGGIVIVALWRVSSQIFRWLSRRLADMTGAEIEPIPGAFRSDFLTLLKRVLFLLKQGVLSRFSRKAKPLLPEIASVRQIYRQFLHWAAAAGYPRQSFQTPYEYLYALADHIPEARVELDLITQQYVSTRYGYSLPTGDEIERMKQSWQKLRQYRLKRNKDARD